MGSRDAALTYAIAALALLATLHTLAARVLPMLRQAGEALALGH